MHTLVSQQMTASESALSDLIWGLGATVAGGVALINPRGVLEWFELRRGRGGSLWQSRVVGAVFIVLGPVMLVRGTAQLLALKASDRPSLFHRTHGLPPVSGAVMIGCMVLAMIYAWRTSVFLRKAWAAHGLPRIFASLVTLTALSFATTTAFGYTTASIMCFVLGAAATAGLALTRHRLSL
jgi:hypothetical protein